MSGEVFRSALANTLRKTLDKLPMDTGKTPKVMSKFFEEDTTELAFVDDLEIGGPGLASEKAEGTEIALGTIMEGALTRYVPRTFALKLIISEEAMEDVQYKEAISAGKMLVTSMEQTVEVDAGLQCARAWDSSYTYGDGLPIFSASHTLPHGGTFSNTLATPMSPSVAAVIVMASQAKGLPGHNGVTRGYQLKRVVCPKEQLWTWKTLVKSEKRPDAGNFAAINVVNSEFDLEIVDNQYWDNTSTNFFIQTDAENGWRWIWRVKPGRRSWVNNDHTEMRFAVRARWARGVTDARSAIGSQA